jgi:mannose-6-phosphate isomerase class I
VQTKGEMLLHHDLFEIQKWSLNSPREIGPRGQFTIVCCLTGKLRCTDIELAPGEFFLVPAELRDRQLRPLRLGTSLLRVTIPG